MPSGMCTSKKDHDVKVSDDGMFLDVAALYPGLLTDVVLLYKS